MSSRQFVIQYVPGTRYFQRLNGQTKIIFFVVGLIVMMSTFDLRVLIPAFLFYFIVLLSVKPNWKQLKGILIFMTLMNLLNIVLFFIVNPRIGNDMTQTTTVLFQFNDFYVFTEETLIYFLARILKIFGTLLISLWLITSITPSELASGLYRCKVPYKICTVVSLGFRYMPDILREFRMIKESMQMRGVELNKKKTGLIQRIKQNGMILVPLVLVSFDKVETVASAMDLRGYGQRKKRTYYSDAPAASDDYLIRGVSLVLLIGMIGYFVLSIQGKVPHLWIP